MLMQMAGTSSGGQGPRRAVAAAAAVGVFVTLVSLLPLDSFAYRSSTLHVAIETVATFVALLRAVLLFGRFPERLGGVGQRSGSSLRMSAATHTAASARASPRTSQRPWRNCLLRAAQRRSATRYRAVRSNSSSALA